MTAWLCIAAGIAAGGLAVVAVRVGFRVRRANRAAGAVIAAFRHLPEPAVTSEQADAFLAAIRAKVGRS